MFRRPLAPSSGRVLPDLARALPSESGETMTGAGRESSRPLKLSRGLAERTELAGPGALVPPNTVLGKGHFLIESTEKAATGSHGILKGAIFKPICKVLLLPLLK